MTNNSVYTGLLDAIREMPVIDTHEHIESEEARLKRKIDLFNTYMIHYASCDLISAGMPDEDMMFLKGESDDLEKKWSIFRPYWEKARNTTYCKALLYATDIIYGVNDINENTYKDIDLKIKAKNQKGLYKHVLKDICKIEKSILDADVKCDKQFFISVLHFENYLLVKSRDIILNVERDFNISINTLSDWVAFIRSFIEKNKKDNGIACIKCAQAYKRIIKYDRMDFADAERVFNKIISSKEFFGWYEYAPVDCPTKPLEDFMMHVMIQTAAELDVPVQFHTGLQEGNGNIITNANPVNLINLFMEYPRARFDLFHGSYPYAGELCSIAKNFRNVYVDLCWAHIISREYSVRMIEELLDTVPSNKIFGFGGDYCFVEGVCGHLKIAKEDIALALANKIQKGYLSKTEALEIAKRMLYDNAKEFFRI